VQKCPLINLIHSPSSINCYREFLSTGFSSTFFIGVEREREKHLTAREVLLVERRAVGENRLKIAVTAPNTVDSFPRDDALVAAPWTRRILPKFFESPLDARIERVRIHFDNAQLNQMPKHASESWLSRTHIAKLALVQCNYTVFPQFYIRANTLPTPANTPRNDLSQ
jgi:hypothetical protein